MNITNHHKSQATMHITQPALSFFQILEAYTNQVL